MPMLFLCYQMAAILGDERRARETFAALDPEYVNNHTRGLLISALATSGVSEKDNGRRRSVCLIEVHCVVVSTLFVCLSQGVLYVWIWS